MEDNRSAQAPSLARALASRATLAATACTHAQPVQHSGRQHYITCAVCGTGTSAGQTIWHLCTLWVRSKTIPTELTRAVRLMGGADPDIESCVIIIIIMTHRQLWSVATTLHDDHVPRRSATSVSSWLGFPRRPAVSMSFWDAPEVFAS